QRQVPSPHRRRKVERRDHAAHAERMPAFHHAMAGALRCDRQPVELAREAHGEIADVDDLLDLALAFTADLAGLDRYELAQLRLVRAQLLAEDAQQLATSRRGHETPFGEGCASAGYCFACIGHAMGPKARNRLAGDR